MFLSNDDIKERVTEVNDHNRPPHVDEQLLVKALNFSQKKKYGQDLFMNSFN